MSKIGAQKAWITRKRNTLIEAYKGATSAGIKAAIARQFKNDFNLALKDFLNGETKTPSPKQVAPKVAFQQKETTLVLPKSIREKIANMELRIASLEREVKFLRTKVK